MVSNINVYDKVAPLYEEYAFKRKKYIDSVNKLVIKSLNKNMRLLDVGSGDGLRLKTIMNATGIQQAIAIEPSLEMAKLCQKNAKIEVRQISIESENGLFDLGKFHAITALWNVLGHINFRSRVEALKIMAKLLLPGGIIMLDVNNRHNAASYGKIKVIWRKFIDIVNFQESRGDSYYEWHIGGLKIPSYGHLFIHAELIKLFSAADLVIDQYFAVNYLNGEISKNLTQGQLFYILRKK